MKTTITNEIVKFIVHNLISQSYPGNLNYTDDSDEEYNRGWNEALKNYQDNLLQQIKNISPEITDTIVNMIVEEVRNEITDIFIEADQREDRVELYDIEKTLDDLLKD